MLLEYSIRSIPHFVSGRFIDFRYNGLTKKKLMNYNFKLDRKSSLPIYVSDVFSSRYSDKILFQIRTQMVCVVITTANLNVHVLDSTLHLHVVQKQKKYEQCQQKYKKQVVNTACSKQH